MQISFPARMAAATAAIGLHALLFTSFSPPREPDDVERSSGPTVRLAGSLSSLASEAEQVEAAEEAETVEPLETVAELDVADSAELPPAEMAEAIIPLEAHRHQAEAEERPLPPKRRKARTGRSAPSENETKAGNTPGEKLEEWGTHGGCTEGRRIHRQAIKGLRPRRPCQLQGPGQSACCQSSPITRRARNGGGELHGDGEWQRCRGARCQERIRTSQQRRSACGQGRVSAHSGRTAPTHEFHGSDQF